MPSEAIDQLQTAAPAALTVMLAVGLFVGIVVWLSGKRLARPACAVSGLVIGGVGGWWVGNQLAEQGGLVLPLMIGAAIGGALLAAFLFRVWMALSGAILAAVFIPAVSMVWQGTTPPMVELTPAEEEQPGIVERFVGPEEEEAGLWTQLQDTAKQTYSRQSELMRTWWDELGGSGRTLVSVGGLVGAGIGLLLGLILPNASAAVQSVTIGGVLIFFTGQQLIHLYLPDQAGYLPTTPRGTLLVLGLIMGVGLLIQWTLFRRREGKS